MALIDKATSSAFGPKIPSEQQVDYFDKAFKQSKVHDQFSINGKPKLNLGSSVSPSGYDLNGAKPSGPLKDPGTISINNTFANGEYSNNLPSGVDGRI